MKTRISVVIPVYNIEEFLEECIDSVLSQTILDLKLDDGYERNLQVILIDDGSTDNSAKIAKDYAEKYDFIEYHYEENQGLGHARNYGCEFAEGDYIVFLDSDDLVPPKAYERLYRFAEKNNSDMAIGGVWRYKSTRVLKSKIHEIAFGGTEEMTHISKSPQLLYDTTVWNKLIKRSFWEKHNFKFTEGILYEDLPVSIAMHTLANNVSIIYENCYLWRIREGKSKSITQKTDEIKNLEDRLFVMKSIDEFFKENAADEQLSKEKDIKWLKHDLMIFINKFKSMDEEEAQPFIELMKDYINTLNESALDSLNEFEQLKYEYLINEEFEKLVELLHFEHSLSKSSDVFAKDNHVFVEGDKDLLKNSTFCIDRYIEEFKYKIRNLLDVSYKKDFIQVKGFTIVPGLNDEKFSDREFSFKLFNSETHEQIPLEYDNVTIKDFSKFNIPYGSNFSYSAAGYQVYVPYSKIMGNEKFLGENRILITFKQAGVTYNYFAGAARIDVRRTSDLKAKIVDDAYFFFKYDLNNELIIDISSIRNNPKKIYVEDDLLCIQTDNYHDDIFLVYEKDSINEEKKIPLEFDADNNIYSISIDEISSNHIGKFYFSGRAPVIFNSKEFFNLDSDKGIITINTLRDYTIKIDKADNITTVNHIDRIHSNFKFETYLHSFDINDNALKSATLFLKNTKNFEDYYLADGIIDKNDQNKVEFNLRLNDEKIKQNLYQEFHTLYVKYDFDDFSFSTPIYLLDSFRKTYQEKVYHYTLYRSNNSTLRMHVTKVWKKSENTALKRRKNSELKYELFRHLPIKKNRILFESWWGRKYHCNPRYLYEYINENYPEYECVWSFNDNHTPINGNAKRVRRFSLKYYYYLATSKYFVNNVNFPDSYEKRDGQIEIQTMHGTPLKTLGFDVPGELTTKKQERDFIRRCGRWNYLTVQSDFVADITKSCYHYDKTLLKTGYPRTDILFTKNNPEDINKIKEKLGLPLDKKIILYAPTWRLKNKFELMLNIKSFRKSLSDEYVLILKLHPFSVRGWKQPPNDDFIYDLSRFDSIEELYLISDILITDYSSVMFDYSILNRPILLFTYDLDEYKDKLRGMYLDITENRPGPILFTSKEVENAIINIEQTEKENYEFRQKFIEKFNQYERENSSELIFNEVFKR